MMDPGFAEADDRLIESEVAPRLRSRLLGRRLHFYRAVDSTNALLLGEGLRDAPEGTVLVAEEQRRGRGRLGRTWVAPPFRALTFSVLLRPGGSPEQASLVNLVAALAVADAVRLSGGPELRIRWPNDLVSDGGKVCGILSERRADTGALVTGIGLNVSQSGAELPPGGASLRTLTGRAFARAPLLAEILLAFEGVLDTLEREGFEPLRARIEERSSLIGREAVLDLGGRTVTGVATGIGVGGGLVMRTPEGTREYLAGEVVRVSA